MSDEKVKALNALHHALNEAMKFYGPGTVEYSFLLGNMLAVGVMAKEV